MFGCQFIHSQKSQKSSFQQPNMYSTNNSVTTLLSTNINWVRRVEVLSGCFLLCCLCRRKVQPNQSTELVQKNWQRSRTGNCHSELLAYSMCTMQMIDSLHTFCQNAVQLLWLVLSLSNIGYQGVGWDSADKKATFFTLVTKIQTTQMKQTSSSYVIMCGRTSKIALYISKSICI